MPYQNLVRAVDMVVTLGPEAHVERRCRNPIRKLGQDVRIVRRAGWPDVSTQPVSGVRGHERVE